MAVTAGGARPVAAQMAASCALRGFALGPESDAVPAQPGAQLETG
jgi:hypothetical protein